MRDISDREFIFAGALLGIAVILTPVAGSWIWIAVALGLWAASVCVGFVRDAA